MRTTLRICLVAVVVQQAAGTAAAQQAHERPLGSGPFRPVPGSVLGPPKPFENEIDTTTCYPLTVSGRVVGWLARAYAFNGRLLVKRCVEYGPRAKQADWSQHGGENELWEELELGRDDNLVLTRLHLPNETTFSNGSFCSGFLAYWGLSIDDRLVPTIYDLRSRSVTSSRSLGTVNLETDDSGFLPPPRWNGACSEASFDASKANQPIVNLTARRSSR